MDGYTLSRQWFDFAFENPDKITVCQSALYTWLIEVNNRGGWAEKFPFNTEDACKATGVNNRKTIWKALNELAEMGFVEIVFKSSHRHKPSVISLPIVSHDLAGSLDKVINYQSTERTSKAPVSGHVADQLGNGKGTVSGHSNKPINNKLETSKHSFSQMFDECRKIYPGTRRGLETEFADFEKKCKKEFNADFFRAIYQGIQAKKRINKQLSAAGQFVPEWPHFKTYLNQRRWEEQTEVQPAAAPYKDPNAFNSQQEYDNYWGGGANTTLKPEAA